MLRSIPNFHVFRPCDSVETAAAWYSAVTSQHTPTALVLSRQNLPAVEGTKRDALRGGYVLSDCEGTPEVILMATGSEVSLALEAKKVLEAEGRRIRVVSMPCMELFCQQTDEYRESVLPRSVTKRVAIEAAPLDGAALWAWRARAWPWKALEPAVRPGSFSRVLVSPRTMWWIR